MSTHEAVHQQFISFLRTSPIKQAFGVMAYYDAEATEHRCTVGMLHKMHGVNNTVSIMKLYGVDQPEYTRTSVMPVWVFAYALMYLNDSATLSFNEIADILETHSDRVHFYMKPEDFEWVRETYPQSSLSMHKCLVDSVAAKLIISKAHKQQITSQEVVSMKFESDVFPEDAFTFPPMSLYHALMIPPKFVMHITDGDIPTKVKLTVVKNRETQPVITEAIKKPTFDPVNHYVELVDTEELVGV